MHEDLYGDSEEYVNRLSRLSKSGRHQEAFKWLSSLLASHPDDFIILADFARICLVLGYPDKAIIYANKAFDIDQSAWTFNALTDAMLAVKDYSTIIDLSEKYERQHPDEALSQLFNDSLLTKAEAYLALQMFNEANSTVVRHITHRNEEDSDFSHDEVMQLLYRIKVQKESPDNHYDEDEDDSGDGYFSFEQARDFDQRINQLEEDGDFNTIYDWLSDLLTQFPKEYYLHVKLSQACLEIGKREEGLDHAFNAYNSHSSDPLCADALIEALWMNNRDSDVVKYADQLLARGVDEIAYCRYGDGIDYAKEIVADTLFFKAASLFSLGKYEDSQKAFFEFRRHDLAGVNHGINREDIDHLDLMLQLLSDTSAN